MVYCGKPSKGCSNCRERKIRCDQRESGCGQCEKKGQKCPGYRNIVDLMFRDESSHVIKKAKAKAHKKDGSPIHSGSLPEKASNTPTASKTTEPRGKRLLGDAEVRAAVLAKQSRTEQQEDPIPPADLGDWPAVPVNALVYKLEPRCQERGLAYFFSRYVTIDENSCHQRFDFVYDIWKPVSLLPERQADGVLASMTAVGLMGLANMTQSRKTLEAARRSYGTALRLTNNALRSPVEVTKDTTMLSVLVLGLFEMMTEANSRTLKTWQGHINGAAALAKLRGMGQFRSGAGTRMFLMLCQNVMISCIQKEMPMPQTLVDLRNELSRLFETSEPSVEISRPIYKVLQFRYDVMHGHITDPDIMVEKLHDIEGEFERVIATFPESWQYRVFRVSQPHPAVFRDICHIYPKMWVATIWNGLRSCRMLVLETMLNQLSRQLANVATDPTVRRYERDYRIVKEKLERLSFAVLASIPQHFGLLNPLDSYIDTLTQLTPAEERDHNITPLESGRWSPLPPKSNAEAQQGLTLVDPVRAANPEEQAERYMLLTSATNTIIWPLYLLGMSSICPPSMKQYVVERLSAVYQETGSRQAKAIMEIVASHGQSSEEIKLPMRTRTHESGGGWVQEWDSGDIEHLNLPM